MQSARQRKVTEDEKLRLGLKAHAEIIKRIRERYTGKLTFHFQKGQIMGDNPNYFNDYRLK
jgi:hypothetical protein